MSTITPNAAAHWCCVYGCRRARGSDAAALEEGTDLIARNRECAEPAVPGAVPIGSAGGAETERAGGPFEVHALGGIASRPETLDAVETPGDEASHVAVEQLDSRVGPHGHAAGFVDQLDGAGGGDQVRGQVCASPM
jgi:hypothetical protein